jgi:hypothetical protein
MGIAVESEDRYAASVRALFPRGEYWEAQFADPQSDVSLFCKAKAGEIARFRRAMADLFRECGFRTAAGTIGDWERNLLGRRNPGLSLEERRTLLSVEQSSRVDRQALGNAARQFGLELAGVEFPFRPGFFGFSRCGIDRVASPAAYSVLYITVVKQDADAETGKFEAAAKEMLNSYIPYFFYQNGGQ